MPRLPFADWQGQLARLTVFPSQDAITRSAEWWQAATDDQPDETTMNPKKGSGQIQGAFGQGKLILNLEPDRIDWLLAPADREMGEQTNGEFPTLGPATEMVNTFSAIAEKWLTQDSLPAIARIAFGAVLLHPEADRRAGYLRLPDYVPVQVNPESSDFLYQINPPPVASETGIEGLHLNRLSKWSVVTLQSFAFKMSATGVTAQRADPQVTALRLELDINTVPAFAGPFPHARLVHVFRELVAAGRAIATDGVVGVVAE
jgi:hypothetical protein